MSESVSPAPPPTPDVARRVFGAQTAGAERFVAMLAEQGVMRGLIGPREVDRLWDRHILNSAVLAELLPPDVSVVDVGSGAGLPGIPLALARPDLRLTLVEPMAKRVAWLEEVVADLGLAVAVVRGRAEEGPIRRALADHDVVTARAVAPLGRLAGWTLPLVHPGGRLLALKGESAPEEVARDGAAVIAAGGEQPELLRCGAGVLDIPVTVVAIRRADSVLGRDDKRRRRKDQ